MEEAYSRRSVVLGWAITASYLAHQLITTRLPRTDKALPAREDLRGLHYLVGTIILVLVIARLVAWFREGWVKPPSGLPAASWSWGRTMALASYLLLLAAPFLGILFAWSDNLPIHLGPAPAFPQLVGESRPLWMFTGYFHSGMGFMLILLNLTAMISAGYMILRYGRGLLSALPPGFGAFALVGLTGSVYGLSTFRSPEPGPRAVLTFWSILAAVWLVSWLIHRRRAAVPAAGVERNDAPPGTGFRLAAVAAVAAVVAVGAYGPYSLFRVVPWTTTKAIPIVDGRTWNEPVAVPAAAMTVAPETDYERQVRAETYKWCTFCHTTKRGQKPIVGPNLYAIFGQKAGSVPGFAYSQPMLDAAAKGLVWDDKTIAAYIADPQKYMPGTSMIISSGPIEEARRQQAVVNILKRETMPATPAARAP